MKNRRSGFATVFKPVVLTVCSAVFAPAAANAALLYYNGDYDLNDAANNESKVPVNFAGSYSLETDLVYTDFVVPVGQTWTITSLFTNDQMAYYANATTATWQIRSGMTPGNGGTLVASGDTAATMTLLHSADYINYIDNAYNVSAAVTSVRLTAGVYWMAVAPDSVGYYGDQSYNETTSGANAVGLPISDGDSYLNNTFPAPGTLTYQPSALDYSAGINGSVTSVPEPGSMLLAAAGALACLGRRRLRTMTDRNA